MNDFKQRRARAKKTQAQVAEETGLTKDTIYRIENGKNKPQPITLAILTEYYERLEKQG